MIPHPALPPIPDGYVYAGQGPLLPLQTSDNLHLQPAGDLSACSVARADRSWPHHESLRGQLEDLYYCVRFGSPAYYTLLGAGHWPAPAAPALPEGLPPVPEGYDYVGVGPLWPDLDPHTAPLHPRNDLQLHLVHPVTGQPQGWLENSGLNGQARGTHYCARRGSAVHRLLLPHLPTTPTEQEPMPPEPDVEDDELPAGHVRTYDGEVLPEDDAVQIVRRGHCSCRANYDGQYRVRSRHFELAWARADDEDIRWLERENCYAHTDCDLVTLSNGDVSFRANTVRLSDGDYYHEDDVRYDGNGNPFHESDDEYVYCNGEGGYYHRDDCHYCDHNDEWVYGDADDCACSSCSDSDTHVNEYHGSPSPYFHTGPNPSGWGIGFEVEKNEVNGADDEGDYVGSYPLFSGWERDVSCGIEGITHVYDPLTAADKFRADADASRAALNAPSDKTCGGHINISHPSLPPRHLLQSLRTYAPLWYAIYRHRLNNSYCIEDKKVEHGCTKYSPLRTKSFGVEFRLPSGVRNHDQLVRRFELMSLVCQAIDAGWSLNRYAKECRSLLLHGAYEGDRNKYAKILRLTRHFNRWFQDGHIHTDIAQYV
jgi:hypothetical protein